MQVDNIYHDYAHIITHSIKEGKQANNNNNNNANLFAVQLQEYKEKQSGYFIRFHKQTPNNNTSGRVEIDLTAKDTPKEPENGEHENHFATQLRKCIKISRVEISHG
jgi:hypothetical protein